jgi:hypothetical protein
MALAFFRHGSNALLASLVLVLAGLFFAKVLPFYVAASAAGAAIFFIVEYLTHRFAFHAKPSGVPALRALQHRLHYDHHVDPGRLDLLFLPWWFVLPATVAYGILYYAATRSPALAAALLLGNLGAMLYYEWVHYVAHIPFVPITPLGKWMKKYHLLHHYLNEQLWFGVTNPAIDVLAHTYMKAADAERSARTKVLYP